MREMRRFATLRTPWVRRVLGVVTLLVGIQCAVGAMVGMFYDEGSDAPFRAALAASLGVMGYGLYIVVTGRLGKPTVATGALVAGAILFAWVGW